MVNLMKRYRAIVLAISGLLVAQSVFATSTRDIGPLADVDEVSLDVLWGDSLGIGNDRGTPLFDTDTTRAAEVKAAVLTATSAHLRKGGLQVVSKSDNVISLGFFGGKFDAGGCPTKNFFMMQVTVCVHGQERCFPERTILGVVGDAGLAQALTGATLEAVDEFIDQRAAYRQTRKR